MCNYTESGRVFRVFQTYCEDTFIAWVSAELGADRDSCNAAIEAKRQELQSRWNVNLRPYTLPEYN
jgi:hypothetical protein